MSDSKDKENDKTSGKTDDLGRKIWLAGLGAYGQSIDNMQSSVEKVNSETRNFFEKLVSRGEELETATRKTINETCESAVKKTNSRIQAQREKLASQAEKIQNLKAELENLSFDKLKPELSLDHVAENITSRLNDIRSKVSQLIPGMVTREDIQILSEKIDKLTAATTATRPAGSRSRKSPPKAGGKAEDQAPE